MGRKTPKLAEKSDQLLKFLVMKSSNLINLVKILNTKNISDASF